MPIAFELGLFRVDKVRRLLVRLDQTGSAQPIAVGERALDILLMLIEHAGQVVSKTCLLRSVWSGATVEDSNLSVQVSNLRRAVDPDAPAPNLIKTVHGRGYLLAVPVREVDAAPTRTAIVRPGKTTIAVLPFRTINGNSEQDDFVDGLTEDITSALSSMRSLSVVARHTAYAYKARAIDIQQVGRELSVRYVLEGGVRQAGTRTRVTTHLVDVASGTQIWSEHFDGVLRDDFDLQDRISSEIVRALELRLLQAEMARVQSGPAKEDTAYELFLQTYGFFHELNESSFDRRCSCSARRSWSTPPMLHPTVLQPGVAGFWSTTEEAMMLTSVDVA